MNSNNNTVYSEHPTFSGLSKTLREICDELEKIQSKNIPHYMFKPIYPQVGTTKTLHVMAPTPKH